MEKNIRSNKKTALLLFFTLFTSIHTTQSSVIKYAASCTVAHLFGLYKAYKHVYHNNKNLPEEEDEKKSFLLFVKNIITEYPIIKEIAENEDFKKIINNKLSSKE
ncbi:hypothetical protein EKK58_01905 [Candidatus Dependentiae bacterium]|nr:MAG: hypothetical protein EKK58_01905 [Candidatus Dependentiae bacterium]